MKFRASLFASIAIAMMSTHAVSAGSIKFTAEVPAAPASLPLLRLTPQAAPTDLITQLLSQTPGAAKLEPLGDTPFFRNNRLKVPREVIGVVEGEHVRAWVDQRTGDVAIYPTLDKLQQITPSDVERQTSRASEIFRSPGFIAQDDTRFVVDKPNTLNGATLVRDANGNVSQEKPTASYLAFYAARRFAGNFPVDGPGSRALLELGSQGAVEGLTRVWKSAKTTQMVRPSATAEQVRTAITSQLRPAIANSEVIVDRIELAYYDGNGTYLQPVYRFTAQIHQLTMPQTPPRTADNFVIGYVPFARAFEPLPVLGKSSGAQPKTAATNVLAPKSGAAPSQSKDPTVGRYVVRNDDPGWVNDANAFWSSLSSTWTGSLFSNSQYYWAEPRLFTNQKNSFINAMNLAVVEVHGDWWLFSTLQNCCDLVNINGDIPSPGYGPSANGSLADWVIHSCEVVPAPDDTNTWPTPWWTVFGGVRNVVGYRTIMYISDGAGGPYGTSLGKLAPVVSSWLSDVMSLNAYAGHPTWPAHGNITRPMGRPSTISMCGHDGDSVLSTSSLGRANCLTVWWFPD
jgi:Family of unknown function (DUF6345)